MVPIPAGDTADGGTVMAVGTPEAAFTQPPKVAIIVGPVGAELTPVYIEIAEEAAARATELGGAVSRAYSPDATPENVLAAMDGANIVVYLGHGLGFPNPYAATVHAETTNGFGLQGPAAHGDHSDSLQDGTLKYYGEAWLAANARPAPGWVMIHSNVCYAPGAGEGFDLAATAEVAAARVANYSRAPLLEMGAAAYFATDFYQGAAEIVEGILARPESTFADVFESESRYQADAVSRVAHPLVGNAEIWLHRSPYFEGKTDYWYAFAGDPSATPALVVGGDDQAIIVAAPPADDDQSEQPIDDSKVTGIASHYPGDQGWEDQPTVSLPPAYGGGPSPGEAPTTVVVCADHCAMLLVVDVCDCYAGTPDARAINLSERAWRLVTDRPHSDGLVEVTIHVETYQRPPGVDSVGP